VGIIIIVNTIIIWLGLSVIAGIVAANKGRSGFGFFLLSVLLSPLIGIIAALVAKRNQSAVEEDLLSRGQMKKCPYCAELVRTEASVCRYCGKELTSRTRKVVGGIVIEE
jgi:hypothetical protein